MLNIRTCVLWGCKIWRMNWKLLIIIWNFRIRTLFEWKIQPTMVLIPENAWMKRLSESWWTSLIIPRCITINFLGPLLEILNRYRRTHLTLKPWLNLTNKRLHKRSCLSVSWKPFMESLDDSFKNWSLNWRYHIFRITSIAMSQLHTREITGVRIPRSLKILWTEGRFFKSWKDSCSFNGEILRWLETLLWVSFDVCLKRKV